MNERMLLPVSAFEQALIEAKTIPEVKNLADQADLFRQWLKKQRVGIQAQNAGAEMHLKAVRKLGVMLRDNPEIRRGGSKLHDVTLNDYSIEKIQSSRWQKLAEIPNKIFEQFITEYQEALQEITTNALWHFYSSQIICPLTEKIPLPEGKFSVIICDPPWQYEANYNPQSYRGAARYAEMSFEQLITLDIPAADDCIFWLWTTNAFMHDAYHLLEIWEFEPKTILTWFKERIGTGYWLRGETEHCLLAIKGKPHIYSKAEGTHLKVKALGHSIKPDEFYQLIERLCGQATKQTHLEMFARKKRENWEVWGNELGI